MEIHSQADICVGTIETLCCSICGNRFKKDDEVYGFHNSDVLVLEPEGHLTIKKHNSTIQNQYSIYICKDCKENNG